MKKHCRIKIGFLALLFIVCLCFTAPHYFPALILSVSLHELGHIVAARLLKIRLSELKLGIFGAALRPSDALYSYGDEIILCLGGPLFNFLSVIISVLLFKLSPASLFVMSSLALGILNLLPVSGFDGGRVASALLHLIFSDSLADMIMRIISFFVIFSLWCISLYLLLRVGASLSLFVFCVSIFSKIFIGEGL